MGHKTRIIAAISVLISGLVSLSGVTVSPDLSKMNPMLSNGIDETATTAPGISGYLLSVFREPPSRSLLILSSDDPELGRKMTALGAEVVEVSRGYHVGKIPVEAVRYISNWPSVRYLEASRRVRSMLDTSRPAILADIVQNGTGAGLSGVPYTGLGAYVGIVDTGLYGAHRDFYDNGSLSSPRVSAYLGYPGFTPGTDTAGHGTHVTGIAAGNGYSSGGLYTGIAPRSRIIFYTTSFETTDILAGISSVFSSAGASPVSVNLSLGLMEGPHDGTSAFESAVNSLSAGPAGSKRSIAVAAGNEGYMREHFQATVPSLGASTSVQVLVPTPPAGYSPGGIDLWASGSNDPAKASEHDEYLVDVTGPGLALSAASGRTATSVDHSLTIYNRVDTSVPNGATHISILPASTLEGRTLTITLSRTWAGGDGTVDGYLDAYASTEGFSPYAATGTLIEPANGDSILAVGSFNSKRGDSNGIGALTSFSSLGPTRDNRVKPDLAAPGSFIFSTRSRNATFSSGEIVSTNDNYVIMSGTSMATPHVTGLAAMVWESNPNLTGVQLRERIRRSATAVGAAPNNSWGYGKTNALAAVSTTIAAISSPESAPTGSPVSLDSSASSGAFGNPLTFAWALVSRPTGSSATLSGSGSTASFIPDRPGDYTVALTATQNSPPGISPAVSTRTIRANRLPAIPVISGPSASDDNVANVFSAASTDPDGLSLSWDWVLVSSPTNSRAAFSAGGNRATLVPDLSGSYTIGVRANNGFGTSLLALKSFTSGGTAPPNSVPPPAAPSSGGGCSSGADSGSHSGWDAFLLISIALWATRKLERIRRAII